MRWQAMEGRIMNMNNQYNQMKLDLIKKAKDKWQESEWILEFLRSEGNPVPMPTEQEILQWHQNLQFNQQN
jgi:hypothetical protein